MILYWLPHSPCARFSTRNQKAATRQPPKQIGELLQAIDQLVEQNRRLEEQNRQLIDQINALRKILAAPTAAAGDADPAEGDSPESRGPVRASPGGRGFRRPRRIRCQVRP